MARLLYVHFRVPLLDYPFARQKEQILQRISFTSSFLNYSKSALTSEAMRFLQFLPLASVALAVPNPSSSNTKRQASCTSEAWSITQYHTCTNCTYPGATEETTSLVFDFADPNFNPAVTATCELSLLPGASLIGFNYVPCGSGVAFYYDGADLNVERTGVECGK